MPPCHLPPGREYEVIHNLPVIPPGLWDHFAATGRWPAGIAKGLERTADCPWATEMAQYRTSSVVAGGQVVRLATPIRGALPYGWYRHVLDAGTPPGPAATLERYREVMRAPLVPSSPLSPGTLNLPCMVVPVPSIDLALPYPFSALRMQISGRVVDVLPGAFGELVWRIPGAGHPFFSTAACVSFIDPKFLSPLGLAWYRERPAAVKPAAIVRGAFDRSYFGEPLNPMHVTRHYQVSHMQCLTPLHDAAGVKPPWRWALGGKAPRWTGERSDPDWFEVSIGGRWTPGFMGVLNNVFRDASGRDIRNDAPEAPFWSEPGVFHGPPPGAFLVS